MAIGLFFALNAAFNLRLGTLTSMGPAYFPIMVGAGLTILGGIIAFSAIGKENEEFGVIPWRGIGLVTLSILFFAFTVRGLGLAISLGGATFLSAIAPGKLSIRGSLILSVVLTFFSIVVFVYLLGLPYPVIGRWILG